MKTTVLNSIVLNNAKMLEIKAEGVHNLKKMFIITQRDDIEEFNMDQYFHDGGGMILGTDYLSNEYTYGTPELIQLKIGLLSIQLSEFDTLCEEDGELQEVYFMVFDAGNGKEILVTNAVETYSYLDVDAPDYFPGELNIVCGAIADDNDISTIMGIALLSHPLTKGIKVRVDSCFADDEIQSWKDFSAYHGTFFSDSKSLKTDPEWFEFFEAVNREIVLNPDLDHCYDVHEQAELDDVAFIFSQYKSCKDLPDQVFLQYKQGNSNKFYNLEINNCAVLTEYGAIGGNSTTTSEQDFESYEEAKAFLEKKAIAKIKSGYVLQK